MLSLVALVQSLLDCRTVRSDTEHWLPGLPAFQRNIIR